MASVNKLIYLLIIVVLINYATDNFLTNQMSKVDITPYAGSIQCFVGAYMYSPTWNGIPIPSTDDVVFAILVGLLILGIASAFNKQLSKKQKILAFLIPWVAYRIIGYYLMTSVPGCVEQYAVIDEAISPLGIVFAILAVFAIFKFLTRKK